VAAAALAMGLAADGSDASTGLAAVVWAVAKPCWSALADSDDRRAATAFAFCGSFLQPALLAVHEAADPRCASTALLQHSLPAGQQKKSQD